MKRSLSLVLCLLLTTSSLLAAALGEPQAAQNQPPKTSAAFRLEDGTPLKLRLQRTISSADAQVDDRLDFDVLEEVRVGDLVAIPKGSVAWGTVTEAQSKRRMGRGGRLNVNLDAVRLADGTKAALRAVKEVKGGGHTGAMTGAIVGGLFVPVLWPAAPLFLLMHGKDITIPKGAEVTAYVNGDVNLDPVKFGANRTNETQAPPPASTVSGQPVTQDGTVAAAADTSSVVIKSTPDGADITVDGKFLGSTPSTVRLAPGDHTVSVEKSGFKSWQRTVTVSSGSSVTIDATLDKVL